MTTFTSLPRFALLGLFGVSLLLAGCERFTEYTTSAKTAASTRNAAALSADATFWQTFHGGHYEVIENALEIETRAYVADPQDAVTAAHVAWLHMWRLSERARLAAPSPLITDDAVVARRYFQQALTLAPQEARYEGFLAAATLAEAAINQDDRQGVRGNFLMRDAIYAWPEFNLFTGGYALSGEPPHSHQFEEALEWQWQNLGACLGTKLDRAHPQMPRETPVEVRSGPKRACWNSSTAPHNVEGFFLNLGDMLVKSGNWTLGQQMYGYAKFSSAYRS